MPETKAQIENNRSLHTRKATLKNIVNQVNAIRHGRQPIKNLFVVRTKLNRYLNECGKCP